MPAVLLDQPPDTAGLWIPPDALGPGVKIVYTAGRNNGTTYPYGRRIRDIITTEASHTMGGPGTETPQSFANGEMGSSATLAEVATFPAAASPWKVPTLLQSLPLECMGVGSVALTPWGLTHESAELAGDPNAQPWTPDHVDLKARLSSWLIRNPLLQSGDRRWNRLQIRYQVCQSPYPNTAALGGLGFHTMWGDCGLEAGGTNPWSLYCKSPLALDTIVPTLRGLRTLGEVVAGDFVYDERGQPCRVLDVVEVQPERCWRLGFSDGSEVVTDEDHAWVTWTENEVRTRLAGQRDFPTSWAQRPWRTTAEVVATLRQPARRDRATHYVPVAGVLDGPPADLPLDPYLLGVWLGDGTSVRGDISTSTPDSEQMMAAFRAEGFDIGAVQHRPPRGVMFKVLGLRTWLRRLDVLANKHVPQAYLAASAPQRLALLQGLMDTDGSAAKAGQCSFVNTSEQLARSVFFLAASLGAIPHMLKRATGHKDAFIVHWSGDLPCFRLQRKLARLRPRVRQTMSRRIVTASPAPVQPMRCLVVDSPNHMFLVTEACIPTHNCPGYTRRGYPPGKFPGVGSLPAVPGNFRDYYERVGALLMPTIPQEGEDMTPEQAAQLQAVFDLLSPNGSWKPSVWTQTAVSLPDAIKALDTKLTALADRVAGIEDAIAAGVPVSVPDLAITLAGTATVAEASG